MRTLAIIITLSTAAPSLAQNTSPFQGAMPNTVILDSGWQVTPQADRCVLTHQADAPRQDLIVIAPREGDQVVLGTVIPAKGAYTGAVQLTVVALAGQPHQIGRVTFEATTGALGTLLTATWPSDRLLPWLTSATRLAFLDPSRHLVNEVSLAGAGAAVNSLRHCLPPSNSDALAPAPAVPSRGEGTYAGWEYSFDDHDCSLLRQTDEGSRIAIGQMFSNAKPQINIRFADGTRGRPGHWNAKTRLALIASASEPASAHLVDDSSIADFSSVTPKDDALLTGEVDGSFLRKLSKRDWDQLVLRSLPGEKLRFEQHVPLTGSQPVFSALARCAQARPLSPF